MKFNLMPPAVIRYTDDLPEGVGGRASGPFISIRPKYLKDEGIHEHELAHVELFWLTLGLHVLIKQFSRRYSIWNEARAYKRQTWFTDYKGDYMTLDEAAARLASEHYGFRINLQQAKLLIRE